MSSRPRIRIAAVCIAAALWSPGVGAAATMAQVPAARDSLGLGQLPGPGSLGQGVAGLASTATTQLALTGLQTWVSGSATFVLHETAAVISQTTTPRLESTWFSAEYWKVAGMSAVLTLPFLFAASIQALVRSDATLLIRAGLGYLPLAMLAVAVAAPVTMLLLSASDELAAAVSTAGGHEAVNFLDQAMAPLGAVGAASGSPFLLFLLGLLTVAGALVLWIELLMREAAVYVIVLMLPLAFAAFVWPARRIWAIRSLELLAALILSKFAIVAVLSLGGAALGHSVHTSLGGLLAGVVLLMLGAFTPWALLRLLPLSEIASGTAGALRAHSGAALQHAEGWGAEAHRWVAMTAHMRRGLGEATAPSPPPRLPEPDRPTAQPDDQPPVGAADDSASSPAARSTPPPTPPPAPPRAWIREGHIAWDQLASGPADGSEA